KTNCASAIGGAAYSQQEGLRWRGNLQTTAAPCARGQGRTRWGARGARGWPEVAQISDAALQEKAVEAWAFALAHSSFKSIRDIPPAGNPETNEAKRREQTDHLRGVTRLANGIAREMGAAYPELAIDMDVIVAGGLLHDVGKAWEFDPANRKRWKASQKQSGRPSIRHPAYGAH